MKKDELGPVQLEVVRLIAEGHTRSYIATILKIKPRTVKDHFRTLRWKFNVKEGDFQGLKIASWRYIQALER